MRVILLSLLLAALSPALAQANESGITAEERYELGLRYMRRGQYTRALEQLNKVRNFHRDDPISIDAELAIADLHFKRGDHDLARLAYEDFARLHPRHPRLDYVVYRVGLTLDKRAPRAAGRDQTPTEQTLYTLEDFVLRYPDSEHLEEVEKLLTSSRDRLARAEITVARFYARRDAWDAVRRRAEYLLDRYPESKYAAEALALQGTALHAWGRVDEAQAVRDALAEAWPASSDLARLDRALARPPGEPPAEEVFFRPYRIASGVGTPGP